MSKVEIIVDGRKIRADSRDTWRQIINMIKQIQLFPCGAPTSLHVSRVSRDISR